MSIDLEQLEHSLKSASEAKGQAIQQSGSGPSTLSEFKCLIVRARGSGIQTPGSPAKNCAPANWGLFTPAQTNPLFENASPTEAILEFSLQVNEGTGRVIDLVGFNPYDGGACPVWEGRILPDRFNTLIRSARVLASSGPVPVFASQTIQLTPNLDPSASPETESCGPYLKRVTESAETLLPSNVPAGTTNFSVSGGQVYCSHPGQPIQIRLVNPANPSLVREVSGVPQCPDSGRISLSGTIDIPPAGSVVSALWRVEHQGFKFEHAVSIQPSGSALYAPAVTNFTAQANNTQVTLRWATVSGVDSFLIEKKRAGETNWVPLDPSPGTSVERAIPDLQNNQDYFFRIKSRAAGKVDSNFAEAGPVMPILPLFSYPSATSNPICYSAANLDPDTTLSLTTIAPSTPPGSYTFTATGLPAGLSIQSNGNLVGVPSGPLALVHAIVQGTFRSTANFSGTNVPMAESTASLPLYIGRAGFPLQVSIAGSNSSIGTSYNLGDSLSAAVEEVFVIKNPNCKPIPPEFLITGADAGRFAVVTDTDPTRCDANTPLGPDQTCTLKIKFTPPTPLPAAATTYAASIGNSNLPDAPFSLALHATVPAAAPSNPGTFTPEIALNTPTVTFPGAPIRFTVTAEVAGSSTSGSLSITPSQITLTVPTGGELQCDSIDFSGAQNSCDNTRCTATLEIPGGCRLDSHAASKNLNITFGPGAFSVAGVTSTAAGPMSVEIRSYPEFKVQGFSAAEMKFGLAALLDGGMSYRFSFHPQGPGLMSSPNITPSSPILISANDGASVNPGSENDYRLDIKLDGVSICGNSPKPPCPTVKMVVPLKSSNTLVSASASHPIPSASSAPTPPQPHTCAIYGGGEPRQLKCFGSNSKGQVGTTSIGSNISTPLALDEFSGSITLQPSSIATGNEFSCGLRIDGSRLCWGSNQEGKLGLGVAPSSNSGGFFSTPTANVNETLRFSTLSLGQNHGCGITFEGALYCWGKVPGGTPSLEPVRMGQYLEGFNSGDTAWVAVSAGSNHTCGIQRGGSLFCWGSNFYGQLGSFNNSGTDTVQPLSNGSLVRVLGDTGATPFKMVSSRENHSCAIHQDGRLFCWGDNRFGQLGAPDPSLSSPSPYPVGDNTTFKSVSAGRIHTCGVDSYDRVRCWGSNAVVVTYQGSISTTLTYGVLGHDQPGIRPASGAAWDPPLTTLTNGWIPEPQGLSAGATHTCVSARSTTTTQQALFCWGQNSQSQLGLGTPSMLEVLSPTQVWTSL